MSFGPPDVPPTLPPEGDEGDVDASSFNRLLIARPFWVAVELDDKSVEPRPGMTGTAAIYTRPSGFRYFLRRVLLRMQSWASYLIVF